jgi:hypothetical protein
VNVTFTSAHRPALRQTVRVSFLRKAKAKKKSSAKQARTTHAPGSTRAKEGSR